MKRSLGTAILMAVLALVAVLGGGSTFGNGSPDGGNLPAARGPGDLERLHQSLLPLFEIPGVVYTDAVENEDLLEVGVEHRGLEEAVTRALDRLNVPRSLVRIVVTEPIVPVQTLRDSIRPVEGGAQINFSIYVCTAGFNATRAGVAGFVTASHCTDKQGGVESTQYGQPTLTSGVIATETADPVYLRSTCPVGVKGKVCRYSDSAFAQFAAGVPSSLGAIAKTTGANNGSLTIATTGAVAFSVVSEGGSAKGNTVNKVGRTTGWTSGTVDKTCANTGVRGSNVLLLCQDFVKSTVVIVAGGDSGSPVFAITSGDNVELRGVLWGGNKSGTTFIYSPIANVEQSGTELGPLTTH